MQKLPRQKYTKEFKEEAVGMMNRENLSLSEAAKRLQIPDQTLANCENNPGAVPVPSRCRGLTTNSLREPGTTNNVFYVAFTVLSHAIGYFNYLILYPCLAFLTSRIRWRILYPGSFHIM